MVKVGLSHRVCESKLGLLSPILCLCKGLTTTLAVIVSLRCFLTGL